METISIVMLTWNNLEKFLRSMSSMFLFLTEDRIKEFIILDNGSHQVDLKNYLRKLEREIRKVKVIFSDVNLGIAKGRKLLYDCCSGDYIASFDSDIVILNPGLFIQAFLKSLNMPQIMLIGGGGGDHPFFPSMERENIINRDSPEKPEELRIVDEVAGWFHGFKRSILKKFGGPIEMDERFTPFWAEDSDLCVQIKMVGGKCAIFGKGIVAHQWSSCDKKDTQKTLEQMWNKFQDKWYSKFGPDFQFDINDDFYRENYPDSKKIIRPKEHYLKIGTIQRNFYSPTVITELMDGFRYESGMVISEESDEKLTLIAFRDKYFTNENIIEKNLVITQNRLPDSFDTLIILYLEDVYSSIDILKKLISLQKVYIHIQTPKGVNFGNVLEFLSRYETSFSHGTFPHYHFDLIPLFSSYYVLRKKHQFKNILIMSPARNIEKFLETSMKDIPIGYQDENFISKIDNYCLSILNESITLEKNMTWYKNCVYWMERKKMDIIVDSRPFREMFNRCLFLPKKYHIVNSPRCSPKDALERVIGFVQMEGKKKQLVFTICHIDTEDDLEELKENLSKFQGERAVVNLGEMKNINLRDSGFDYYFPVPSNMDDKEIFKLLSGHFKLENYSNIIFWDNSYKIIGDMSSFQEKAKWKSTVFLRTNGEFQDFLYSVMSSQIVSMVTEMQKEDFKWSEWMKKTNAVPYWEEREEETEDEIIINFKPYDFDYGEDYPLE